jgi:hypothetical protein
MAPHAIDMTTTHMNFLLLQPPCSLTMPACLVSLLNRSLTPCTMVTSDPACPLV